MRAEEKEKEMEKECREYIRNKVLLSFKRIGGTKDRLYTLYFKEMENYMVFVLFFRFSLVLVSIVDKEDGKTIHYDIYDPQIKLAKELLYRKVASEDFMNDFQERGGIGGLVILLKIMEFFDPKTSPCPDLVWKTRLFEKLMAAIQMYLIFSQI